MRVFFLLLVLSSALFGLGCGNETGPASNSDTSEDKTVSAENTTGAAKRGEVRERNEGIGNIRESLKFGDEGPAVLSLINSGKLNLKIVGLKKGQVMSKHKAGLKSFLIMLEGKIEFDINGEKFELNKLDTYEIPVNVEHEIRAIDESIFSLTQEK